MSYFFEQSEREIGKKQSLISGFLILGLLVLAYCIPSDIQMWGRVLIIGLPMMILLIIFFSGKEAWEKNQGIWKISIHKGFFDLQYPTGNRFKCNLNDIECCRVVSGNFESRYFLLFFDSTYKHIDVGCNVDFKRIISELKKNNISIDSDIEDKANFDKYPYEDFLEGEGFIRKKLTKVVYKY